MKEIKKKEIIDELEKNGDAIINYPSRSSKNKFEEIVEWISMVVLFIFAVLGVNVFFIWGLTTQLEIIEIFIVIVFAVVWNWWMFVSFQKIWIRIKMIRCMSDMQAMQSILDSLD